MKLCPKCREVKPLMSFHKSLSRPDGVQAYCKDCINSYIKARYHENPEKFRAMQRVNYKRGQSKRVLPVDSRAKALETRRKWAKRNRDLLHPYEMMRRATLEGSTVEYVDPKVLYDRACGVCWLCDMPVSVEEFTVEHKVPLTRGGTHSYANTDIAHRKCNQSKNRMLPEEFFMSNRCAPYLRKVS